jgi:hypothetical protein
MRSNRPQIASLSALLYCPIGSTENRSLRHVRFFVTSPHFSPALVWRVKAW